MSVSVGISSAAAAQAVKNRLSSRGPTTFVDLISYCGADFR
jgi:hypothetical protein